MDELGYEIRINEPHYFFRYVLYYKGVRVTSTDTKWGARRAARRHQKKLRDNPLPGTVVEKW